VPASKKDLPLAKGKPISNSGSASVTTYLKRGEKVTVKQHLQQEGRVRICERNNSADIKVSEEGGGAPDAGAEIPLQPVEETMVRQAVTLQSMEVHGGADIHL